MKSAREICIESLERYDGEHVENAVAGLCSAASVIAAKRGISVEEIIEYFRQAAHESVAEMAILRELAKDGLS
jgi:hypothetical protein